MKKTEYEQMSLREETYWWHLGRLSIVKSILERFTKSKGSILNIGCGTGGTIPTLEKFGKVTNVDISDEALRFLRSKGYDGIKIRGHKLPFADNTFDTIVALDVLEHIDKDRDSLDEWYRVLKKDGRLIVTVPAYDFLWSDHDVSLHHKRRYTKKSLRWDAKKTGFIPIKLTYAIAFSFPLVAGFRTLHKVTKKEMDESTSYVNTPKFINSLFTKFLTLEGKWLKHANLPLGTTVLGVFKKSSH